MPNQLSLAFKASEKLLTASFVLSLLGWALWALVYVSAPDRFGPPWFLMSLGVFFVGPMGIPLAVWQRTGFWVRPTLALVTMIYFFSCYLSSFVAIGFPFLPAATVLSAACALRVFFPTHGPQI